MLRRLLLLSAAALPATLPAQAGKAEVYTVDQAHSLLDFTTRLVGFNRVRGNFGTWRADFAWDPAAPTSGYVSFVAETGSIATQEDERDHDLKGGSFFDVEHFPRMSFEGRIVAGQGTRFDIEGRLTIRDSTRLIRFPIELITPEATDPFGNRRLVFAGKVTLNRRDYGVIGPRFWNNAIADSVTIEMELAGRVWNYRTLAFRSGAYYSPGLVAAADSGRFDQTLARLGKKLAAETDSIRFPTPFETEIAVGRLGQAGRLREAARMLELFAPVVSGRWSREAQSRYEARVGEVQARLGHADDARRHFEQAVVLDPANTNARAWLHAPPRTP